MASFVKLLDLGDFLFPHWEDAISYACDREGDFRVGVHYNESIDKPETFILHFPGCSYQHYQIYPGVHLMRDTILSGSSDLMPSCIYRVEDTQSINEVRKYSEVAGLGSLNHYYFYFDSANVSFNVFAEAFSHERFSGVTKL